MKTKLARLSTALALLALSTLSPQLSTGFGQGTAFTYQGQLFDNGTPANGNYAMQFKCYDSSNAPNNLVSQVLTLAPVVVSNGLFTVLLDFGPGEFSGASRWLQISAATNSGNPLYVPLTPRQLLTPTPYAIFAETASNLSGTLPTAQLTGPVPNANLSGSYSGAVVFNNSSNVFYGSGAGLTNVWQTTGNSGTTPGVNFLGTSDKEPLELHVFGERGIGLDYATQGPLGSNNASDSSINVEAGFWGNLISSGVVGATIAGGGEQYDDDVTGAKNMPNSVTGNFGTVGGGDNNSAGYNATVPGGYGNSATGNGSFAAGRYAQAISDGTFVWSDGSATFIGAGLTANSFNVLATGEVNFYNSPTTTTLRILPGGFVGINTNRPNQQLEVNGEFMLVDGLGGEQAYLGGDGVGNDVQIGSLSSTVTAVSCYNAATSQYMHLYCSSISIEGGSDLAEPFQISSADQAIPEGAVVVIDQTNPGHLKLSDRPYDARVAGVVSGANGIHPGIQMQQDGLLEGGKNVALTGRVYVQADASNGAIQPGDLLTTSSTPGRAMRVSDHAKAQGAILGKAMTTLSEGQGMVLVLVTLQ